MVHLRPAAAGDIPAMVRIRAESVRALAAGHYPAAVIDDWSRPDVPRRRARLQERLLLGVEVMVVAEAEAGVVGFGSLVPALWEIGRLNVDPRWARRGVGSAMLGWLEDAARARGAGHLELDASLNAEAFYLANGYRAVDRCARRLSTGRQMRCVRMAKLFAPPPRP